MSAIGFHVDKGNKGDKNGTPMATNLRAAIGDLVQRGFRPAAQIFVCGPRQARENLTAVDKLAVRRLVTEYRLPLVVHGAYVDNPWGGSADAIANITRELCICREIGALGVVVHLSSKAYESCLEVLAAIDADSPAGVVLYLEINTAKPSPNTFETPTKLRRLFERVSTLTLEHITIGLCIDSAHLWSCGFSMENPADTAQWLAELPDVPTILHLNDSDRELGSGIDKHMPLTRGNIWSVYNPDTGELPLGQSGLVALLEWVERRGIITILERSKHDINWDLNIIYSLGYFREH